MSYSRRYLLRTGAIALCSSSAGCLDVLRSLHKEQPVITNIMVWNCDSVPRTIHLRVELDGEPVYTATDSLEAATSRGKSIGCVTRLHVPPSPATSRTQWRTVSSLPSEPTQWPDTGYWRVSARLDGRAKWVHSEGPAHAELECTELRVTVMPDGELGIKEDDC